MAHCLREGPQQPYPRGRLSSSLAQLYRLRKPPRGQPSACHPQTGPANSSTSNSRNRVVATTDNSDVSSTTFTRNRSTSGDVSTRGAHHKLVSREALKTKTGRRGQQQGQDRKVNRQFVRPHGRARQRGQYSQHSQPYGNLRPHNHEHQQDLQAVNEQLPFHRHFRGAGAVRLQAVRAAMPGSVLRAAAGQLQPAAAR